MSGQLVSPDYMGQKERFACTYFSALVERKRGRSGREERGWGATFWTTRWVGWKKHFAEMKNRIVVKGLRGGTGIVPGWSRRTGRAMRLGTPPVPGKPADRAHPRGVPPPDDARQDRALPSLDEEPGSVADISIPARPGGEDRQLRQLHRTTFLAGYNHQRYHGSPGKVALADTYFGRAAKVRSRREKIKRKVIEARRRQHPQMRTAG